MLFDRGFAPDIDRRFQSCAELTSRVLHVLGAPKDQAEDPKVLSAFYGQELQEGDRKTQLQTHKGACAKVIANLSKLWSSAYLNKIPPFKILSTGVRSMSANTFPQEVEDVGAGMAFTVTLPLHGSREIRLAFGAEGNQTVMLGQLAVGHHRTPQSVERAAQIEWLKVLWFSPDGLPSDEALNDAFRRYINAAMKELRDVALEQAEE